MTVRPAQTTTDLDYTLHLHHRDGDRRLEPEWFGGIETSVTWVRRPGGWSGVIGEDVFAALADPRGTRGAVRLVRDGRTVLLPYDRLTVLPRRMFLEAS